MQPFGPNELKNLPATLEMEDNKKVGVGSLSELQDSAGKRETEKAKRSCHLPLPRSFENAKNNSKHYQKQNLKASQTKT